MSLNASSLLYEIVPMPSRKPKGKRSKWHLYQSNRAHNGQWLGAPILLNRYSSKDDAIAAARMLAGRTHEIEVHQ